ncbi:WecB/TagA/CpsF family glycosyltransferase [Lentilactobacillus sp. Marseille-Q4993]|uniref:WecB/TagA/CpsF family glycosyltransferase n=1 Tax=Lentilactobacillus sp. Marseille-Q4993 TaxID=3039492 RepID=UPI0024BD37B6|nr:WecB/TagA/CpsF family glycosyltransferase [Lentilactobacillus sp. Marseille-Q4993]
MKTTISSIIPELTDRIEANQRTFVVTANPEIVMYANEHEKFLRIIQNADYVVADGIGIVIGSRLIKDPLPERVTGYDIFEQLLTWGAANHKKAFFLGAKPEVIAKLNQVISTKFSGLEIAGAYDGYFKDEAPIVEAIKESQPDMVFVATGSPKQEEFIQRNLNTTNGLFMGIGGSFDVLTGSVKRAPKFWQNAHLEWLYRVIKEPARISRLAVLPKYLLKVRKQK